MPISGESESLVARQHHRCLATCQLGDLVGRLGQIDMASLESASVPPRRGRTPYRRRDAAIYIHHPLSVCGTTKVYERCTRWPASDLAVWKREPDVNGNASHCSSRGSVTRGSEIQAAWLTADKKLSGECQKDLSRKPRCPSSSRLALQENIISFAATRPLKTAFRKATSMSCRSNIHGDLQLLHALACHP
jgi:hypothetical protein